MKPILENLSITSVSGEGKGIARHEGRVVFVDGAVAGDVVHAQLMRSKKNFAEAKVVEVVSASVARREPACVHFGICGGCRWQYMHYEEQLRCKQQTVRDALERIGHLSAEQWLPIIGCEVPLGYRNKMEFAFTDRRWLTDAEIASGAEFDRRGVGLHVPDNFLAVVDVKQCLLQASVADEIRNELRQFGLSNKLSFYDLKRKEGLLRNVMIRTAVTGEVLVLVSFGEHDPKAVEQVMCFLRDRFPQITSLQFVINTKKNDTIYDLDVHTFHGSSFITEQLGPYRFRIRAKSFFQTNTRQAERLYEVVRQFAALQSHENVYDLYTGVGSIAIYLSPGCRQMTGIEQVEDAIADAEQNAAMNHITNCRFVAGDVRMTLNDAFIAQSGRPDVIITDPPRAGMHEEVVKTILTLAPQRVVYVSCNPATQARDVALMAGSYTVEKVQPVDMFPQTTHIENVILLKHR